MLKKWESFTGDNINYKLVEEEDILNIEAIHKDKIIGSVSAELLYEAYELFDDIDEDLFYEIFESSDIVKITQIKVDAIYRGEGIAKQLLNTLIRISKENGLNQFYLNAYPNDRSGLNLEDLVNFYEEVGFKVLKDDGRNIQMYLV